MPSFDTSEGIQMLDQVVTCELPDDDQELKDLVERLQTHKYTHAFFKNGNYCRFSLAISALDPRKLLNNPHDLNSLQELNRLRNLELASNNTP